MKSETELLGPVLDEIGSSHGRKLKNIALTAIRSQLSGMRYKPRITDPLLREKAGIYVTLENQGEMRGCIGFVYPTYELWAATKRAAIHAAYQDPRFKPIERDELETLEVEISVIGPVEKVRIKTDKDADGIQIGTHGLMVVGNGSTGLLLPQVAEEMELTPVEFLMAACEKGGLDQESWRNQDISVYRFPVKVFR